MPSVRFLSRKIYKREKILGGKHKSAPKNDLEALPETTNPFDAAFNHHNLEIRFDEFRQFALDEILNFAERWFCKRLDLKKSRKNKNGGELFGLSLKQDAFHISVKLDRKVQSVLLTFE